MSSLSDDLITNSQNAEWSKLCSSFIHSYHRYKLLRPGDQKYYKDKLGYCWVKKGPGTCLTKK